MVRSVISLPEGTGSNCIDRPTALLFLSLQQLLQLHHFVAVLRSFNVLHLVGGLLHQAACALDALFKLLTAHVFHYGVGNRRDGSLLLYVCTASARFPLFG